MTTTVERFPNVMPITSTFVPLGENKAKKLARLVVLITVSYFVGKYLITEKKWDAFRVKVATAGWTIAADVAIGLCKGGYSVLKSLVGRVAKGDGETLKKITRFRMRLEAQAKDGLVTLRVLDSKDAADDLGLNPAVAKEGETLKGTMAARTRYMRRSKRAGVEAGSLLELCKAPGADVVKNVFKFFTAEGRAEALEVLLATRGEEGLTRIMFANVPVGAEEAPEVRGGTLYGNFGEDADLWHAIANAYMQVREEAFVARQEGREPTLENARRVRLEGFRVEDPMMVLKTRFGF